MYKGWGSKGTLLKYNLIATFEQRDKTKYGLTSEGEHLISSLYEDAKVEH